MTYQDDGPPATIAETSSYYHSVLGTDCPWDCSACPSNRAAEILEPGGPTHVITIDGDRTYAFSREEAHRVARSAAARLGRAVKVESL